MDFLLEGLVKKRAILSVIGLAIEEAADGEGNDEECDDIGPDIGNARSGRDDVVVGDEAFAGEGIIDDAITTDACSSIDNYAWHRERVGHVEPEDVQTVCQFLV